MKKRYLITLLLVPFLFVDTVFADMEKDNTEEISVSYTKEEVVEHDTSDDCWMIFEKGVYDITEYLTNHDKFMDIREWCGEDMTDDFRDKAGVGRDHREGTYELLEKYKVGELDQDFLLEDVQIEVTTEDEHIEDEPVYRKYDILTPFVLTTLLYWIWFVAVRRKVNPRRFFNVFWNTILLLSLLIPGMAFGVFMILRTQISQLWDINFDFMYWHVQLSLFMSFAATYHFIQRFRMYIAQFKKES